MQWMSFYFLINITEIDSDQLIWQIILSIFALLQASALLALPIVLMARVFSAVFWSVLNVFFKIHILICFLLMCMSSWYMCVWLELIVTDTFIVCSSKKVSKPARNGNTHHARRKPKRGHLDKHTTWSWFLLYFFSWKEIRYAIVFYYLIDYGCLHYYKCND